MATAVSPGISAQHSIFAIKPIMEWQADMPGKWQWPNFKLFITLQVNVCVAVTFMMSFKMLRVHTHADMTAHAGQYVFTSGLIWVRVSGP